MTTDFSMFTDAPGLNIRARAILWSMRCEFVEGGPHKLTEKGNHGISGEQWRLMLPLACRIYPALKAEIRAYLEAVEKGAA